MSQKSSRKLNQDIKSLYIKTDRRQFMAQVVKSLGIGGQTFAEKELGWNRRTIRKGMQELDSGVAIRRRLNELGYTLKRILKTKPIKKIPETEAIFEQVEQINDIADNDPHTLRISMDAKVALKVGEFDRGGKTRMPTNSLDHDFCGEATLIPDGIFVPQYNELFLFFVTSKLTADCIVDLLENWWETVKDRFHQIKTLVINQDNGPENNSRRTQFMKRIVDFSTSSQLNLQLAYYPPYLT